VGRTFALGGSILQGKALSYNNVLDASGAYSIARQLRGPAVVIVKHTNPCGAAERATLAEAWQDALAGDPASAYGGVVALTAKSMPPQPPAWLDLPRSDRGPVLLLRGTRDPLEEAESAAARGFCLGSEVVAPPPILWARSASPAERSS